MKMLVLLLFLLSVPCHAGTCRVVWNLGSQGYGHGSAIPCGNAYEWQRHQLFPGEIRYVEKRVLFFFWKKDDEPGREKQFWDKHDRKEFKKAAK